MKIKNEKIFIQIACLLCSVVLWVLIMIRTNPIYEDTISNVPVNIKNLAALESSNMVLMNSDKDNFTVNVKVKGNSDQLNKISKNDFNAYIDVLGFAEGTKNAKVEILGPNSIEISSTYPSQIACVVESVVSKVMDVTVQYEGKQVEGYYRANGITNPSSVKITGPRSIVNSAKWAIATVNVDLSKDTVIKTGPVRIYDGKDTEIFMSAPVGNVEVIVPVYPTKVVYIKSNIIGEPLEGYKLVDVSVKPNKIKIAAKKDILDSIIELEVEELDITDAYHNKMSSKEILNNNDFIILDEVTAPVVNALVEKIIKKEITYNLDEVEFNNIPEGYKVNLDKEDIIIVMVEDATSVINSFKKEDLKIKIDLLDVSIGLNRVKLEYFTEKEIDSIMLNLDEIEIELELVESINNDTEQTNTEQTNTETSTQ